MNVETLKQSQETLLNYFELKQLDADNIAYEKLLASLSEEIAYLIDFDFEHLIFILYRIDVSEDKVKEAIACNDFKKAPRKIAELIIARQIEKVKSREKYSNQN